MNFYDFDELNSVKFCCIKILDNAKEEELLQKISNIVLVILEVLSSYVDISIFIDNDRVTIGD